MAALADAMTERTTGRQMAVGLMLPIWTRGSGLPDWTLDPDREAIRWPSLLRLAKLAEGVGFDALWVPDHVLMDEAWGPPDGDPAGEAQATAEPASGAWDCWSILAALAATTSSIELGTLVNCTAYRNPARLAKVAATVEEISGGRLTLGLGAGDHWREHQALGIPWAKPIGRFEEALQIIVPLLREGRVDFAGAHYSARDCELVPRGPRPHGPPILIGALGTGPRMLRLVAQHADIWNGWYAFDDADARPLVEAAMHRVGQACMDHGRSLETLERSVGISVALSPARAEASSLTGTPEEIAEGLAGYRELGVDHIQVVLASPTEATVAGFGRVLERLDSML
jgi:alkanesulfonate monooxygenase SsuD/methylene tetrahydromethanopterin reductase-like flavin-dependent oxidoreductase (luciferase family)